jgi:hypothetical protein
VGRCLASGVCARDLRALVWEGRETNKSRLVVGQVDESVGEGRGEGIGRRLWLRHVIIGRKYLGRMAGVCSILTRLMSRGVHICRRKRVRIVGWLMERLIID